MYWQHRTRVEGYHNIHTRDHSVRNAKLQREHGAPKRSVRDPDVVFGRTNLVMPGEPAGVIICPLL